MMPSTLGAVFDESGFVLCRKVFFGARLMLMMDAWEEFAKKQREVRWNPVEVVGPFPPELEATYRDDELLDCASAIMGSDIALYNFRFVVKDKDASGPVFLHQDSGYHVGQLNKMSAFVALTPVNRSNGGLVFYPGTHRFGYLGDTGEINTGLVDITPVCPEMEPGDVVFMHSSTWHESGPNVSGDDRVLADIILQPTTDPSGIALLRGKWHCEPRAFLRRGDVVFKWSRSSRLRELQAKVTQ